MSDAIYVRVAAAMGQRDHATRGLVHALRPLPHSGAHSVDKRRHHFAFDNTLHTLSYIAIMESQREDLPRVSVDTIQDWQRVKESYTSAALTILEQEIQSVQSPESVALRSHLQQVKYTTSSHTLLSHSFPSS